jgi:multiple sugar transport system permease protein
MSTELRHPPTTAAARRGAALLDDERWLGRLLLAPAILYIALLVGFPFLVGLYYSVSDATVGTRVLHFVGLENFRLVLANETKAPIGIIRNASAVA